MSAKDVLTMFEKAKLDSTFLGKLLAANSAAELVEIGRAAGYHFEPVDIVTARDELFEFHGARELSDGEMSGVAGGAGQTANVGFGALFSSGGRSGGSICTDKGAGGPVTCISTETLNCLPETSGYKPGCP